MMVPENEVPVALPMNTVLVRTDDVAAALVDLQVYTTGLSFTLIVRVRPAAAGRLPVGEALIGRAHPFAEEGRARFLIGVEFSDGRRGSSLQMRDARAEIVFNQASSSSGDTGGEQTLWLSPLPPDGPLRLVVRCPEIGIPETSTELDGTAIRRAADGVVTLWPWAMPDPSGRRPEPSPSPELPGDSWFAG
jgi:hypothetical protein